MCITGLGVKWGQDWEAEDMGLDFILQFDVCVCVALVCVDLAFKFLKPVFPYLQSGEMYFCSNIQDISEN